MLVFEREELQSTPAFCYAVKAKKNITGSWEGKARTDA